MTMTKVKIVACLALISGVLATGVAVVAQSGAAKPGTDPAPKGARKGDNDVERLNRAIQAMLDGPTDEEFTDKQDLQYVLKYIGAKTRSPELEEGIPILPDRVGWAEAYVPRASWEEVIPKGTPLRSALRDVLRRSGLDFEVADGHLMISSKMAILGRRLDRLEAKVDRALAARPALVADPAASRSRPPASLLEAKVEACRAAFDATKRYFEEKPGLDLDSIYLWSHRLMQAEIDRDGRESAGPARAHLGRMKDLETRIETDFQAGRGTDLNSRAAAYYRRDAEAIVATYGGPQAGDTQPRPKD